MLFRTHQQLPVFQQSVELAVEIFQICMRLPEFERFMLVAQWLRSSRSVCANIAEAWRKRYYKGHFVSKLSDAEGEAAESQTWALLSYRYGYIDESTYQRIVGRYDEILAQLSAMARDASKWEFRRGQH